MNCPKCNAVISDDSKFCTRCGAKIEKVEQGAPATPPAPVCIKCGAPLKPGAKFCVKCGANQSEQSAPQQTASAPQPAQSAPQQTASAPQPAQSAPQQAASAPQPAQSAPQQAPSAPQPAKKSKLPIVLVVVFVLIVAFIVGGYFLLDKVFDVNVVDMIMGNGDEDQDKDKENDSKDTPSDKDKNDSSESGSKEAKEDKNEKGDPKLLDALDGQAEAAQKALDEGDYQTAITQSTELIKQYMKIGEENNLAEEAAEKVEPVFAILSKATIENCKGIEGQAVGSAGYEQVSSMVDSVLEVEKTLKEKGYEVDSSEITEYGNGTIQRFKDAFIYQINEFTKREQWSRDEAWTYAQQAYSIKKDGKTLLFDENDLDDPARLRYAYCLAWITRKRCENGVADGSMSNEDAFNAAVAILQETDYNLLVLQDIISYGSAAGKDVSSYQMAYNAIVQELKDEQNLSIVNTGINSATSVDIRKFWYFNDLDGEDAYKVDINNGTTQATRDWIRDNIPSYINN